MSFPNGGSPDFQRRMNATDFGMRFTTNANATRPLARAAAVPEAWKWFIVFGSLYQFRLRQDGQFRITKTVLKATTYVTGTWCVVDLAAVLGASNMSSIYDGSDGAHWSSSENTECGETAIT